MQRIRGILAFVAIACIPCSQTCAESTPFTEAYDKQIVDWQSWSPELLQLAKEQNKPLFFYAAHFGNSLARTMRLETFANKMIAGVVNDTSIPILVDVNQEPELAAFLKRLASSHYNTKTWPICLWTNSSLAPIAGGGYLPPTDDWGSQGFLSIAKNVSEKWNTVFDETNSVANAKLTITLATSPLKAPKQLLEQGLADTAILEEESKSLSATEFRAKTQALDLVDETRAKSLSQSLEQKLLLILESAGFDSIDGGFFNGATDPQWSIPRFQKSASDQAQMLSVLARLHKRNPKPEYKDATRLTVGFLKSRLMKENGLVRQGFDSFSEGDTIYDAEGDHYLFEKTDLQSLSAEALELWELNSEGNLDASVDVLEIYKGKNIANAKSIDTLSASFDEHRASLQKIRSQREAPLEENVAYVATNSLVVCGLLDCYAGFGEKSYLELASSILESIESQCLSSDSGKLLNSDLKSDSANSMAYAYFISACIKFYDTSEDEKYLTKALEINSIWTNDPSFDSETSVALRVIPDSISSSVYRDGATPSVVGVHYKNLMALAKATNDDTYKAKAESLIEKTPTSVADKPGDHLTLLLSLISN